VAQLCRVTPAAAPAPRSEPLPESLTQRLSLACGLLKALEQSRLRAFIQEYAHARRSHFGMTHAFTQVLGQDNLFAYRPREGCALRVEPDATLFDALASCLAAELCGTQLAVSVADDFAQHAALRTFTSLAQCEPLAQLEARIATLTQLRVLGARQDAHALLCSRTGAHLADEPVLGEGGFELLHYLREQSISIDYHRYGNLGARGLAT
jgi:RHH-type proline utilization regulon transcriptional repressor/proline dehydrogenase/delta 1-pyrroline-5-carboxylate dehydrogenase